MGDLHDIWGIELEGTYWNQVVFERTGQEIDVRMWHISGNRVIHIKDRNGLLEVMTVNYDDTQIQSEQKKKKTE